MFINRGCLKKTAATLKTTIFTKRTLRPRQEPHAVFFCKMSQYDLFILTHFRLSPLDRPAQRLLVTADLLDPVDLKGIADGLSALVLGA